MTLITENSSTCLIRETLLLPYVEQAFGKGGEKHFACSDRTRANIFS